MSVNKNAISNQLQNRGEFAQIPNEVWQVKDLSLYARSVWIYLASEGPGWDGSYPNISRALDISVNTARKAVKELVTHNMLLAISHKEGTDFELISSDQWKVTWTEFYQRQLDKKANASSASGQRKRRTGANASDAQGHMHPAHSIQKESKRSNTINTPTAEAVGCSEVMVQNFEDRESDTQTFPPEPRGNARKPKDSLPDYQNKHSSWYLHYLKSELNRSTFLSLPEAAQKLLYDKSIKEAKTCGSEAKDNFVSTMIEFRNKRLPPTDAEVNLCDL